MNILLQMLMWILGKLGIIYREDDNYPPQMKERTKREFLRRIQEHNDESADSDEE